MKILVQIFVIIIQLFFLRYGIISVINPQKIMDMDVARWPGKNGIVHPIARFNLEQQKKKWYKSYIRLKGLLFILAPLLGIYIIVKGMNLL
jgi:hypothetical protein